MSGYWLYILYSDIGDRYYVGSSANPEERLLHHNTIERGFTSRYRPWKLVFKKEFPTKVEALAAEKKVKRWKSKKMIERVVKGLTII